MNRPRKPRKHRYFIWNAQDDLDNSYERSSFVFNPNGISIDIIKEEVLILEGLITRDQILTYIRQHPINLKTVKQIKKYVKLMDKTKRLKFTSTEKSKSPMRLPSSNEEVKKLLSQL